VEFLRLSSHLVRVIVRLRGLPTPRPLMVPATDQAPASSDTNYRLPHRNTAHLPARRNTGHLLARPNMARLPVANTTADSFSIRLNRRGRLLIGL
jgi:hypothetical protein